jgi:hypothetical protein
MQVCKTQSSPTRKTVRVLEMLRMRKERPQSHEIPTMKTMVLIPLTTIMTIMQAIGTDTCTVKDLMKAEDSDLAVAAALTIGVDLAVVPDLDMALDLAVDDHIIVKNERHGDHDPCPPRQPPALRVHHPPLLPIRRQNLTLSTRTSKA